MNCNIIRSNSKNELSSTNSTNTMRTFPDKNFNRFKNRMPLENSNVPYKNYRYPKTKKFNKRSDEQPQIDGDVSKLNHHHHHHHPHHHHTNINNNNLNQYDKMEAFSFKCINGNENSNYSPFSRSVSFTTEKYFEINKRKPYTFDFENDLKSNNTSLEHARVMNKEMNHSLSMETQMNKSLQEDNLRFMKTDKRKSSQKWVNKRHVDPRGMMKPSDKYSSSNVSSTDSSDKNQMKFKLNFLQESQLTLEQLADNNNSGNNNENKSIPIIVDFNSTATSVLPKQQMNGLNPSAVEFTPSGDRKTSDKSDKYSSEIVENNLKMLSINGDNSGSSGHQTISNPVVLEDGLASTNNFGFQLYDHQYHPVAAKLTPTDSTLLHPNLYSHYLSQPMPLGRPLSRMNYHPTQAQIVPPFQVALYGGNNQPPLIRYNPSSQNHLPFNYLVCSPVMINGMYNHPHLLSNRLFPLGAAATDIPAAGNHLTPQFAHHFNALPNTNTSNNSNTNIISVSNNNPPSYFTDSMTNSNSGSHIR